MLAPFLVAGAHLSASPHSQARAFPGDRGPGLLGDFSWPVASLPLKTHWPDRSPEPTQPQGVRRAPGTWNTPGTAAAPLGLCLCRGAGPAAGDGQELHLGWGWQHVKDEGPGARGEK